MYIEKQYKLIALSEAKKRHKNGAEVLKYKPCIDELRQLSYVFNRSNLRLGG